MELHSVKTADLRSRQEGPIPLKLDHTELAGEVLTLSRIRGGAVYAIGSPTAAATRSSSSTSRSTFHIRDLEHQKWMQRENERSHTSYIPRSTSSSPLGLAVPPQMRPGWKPRDIEWSQTAGQVLRVS